MKIGIMGGTFNPIHNGHLLLAEAAREELGLEKVLFMPSGNSYMKDSASIASKQHRIEMTALAIADNPYFELSLMETEREGATYTCDTLQELKAAFPADEFYFILGADSFMSVERWKNPEIIMQNCILTVSVRGGNLKAVEEKAVYLRNTFDAKIFLLPERNIDISSTEIRNRLREGRFVKYMLPENVRLYIEENGLYQENL